MALNAPGKEEKMISATEREADFIRWFEDGRGGGRTIIRIYVRSLRNMNATVKKADPGFVELEQTNAFEMDFPDFQKAAERIRKSAYWSREGYKNADKGVLHSGISFYLAYIDEQEE